MPTKIILLRSKTETVAGPSILETYSERKKPLKIFFGSLTLVVAAYFLTQPYHRLLYDVEALRSFIQSFGALAPAVLILTQISQVLIAPIPGPAVGAAAGYTFGVFWGTVYGFIGLAIGSAIAILLAKKYGRPLVEELISDEKMKKFDHLTEEHGFLPFLLLFLLPGFPDDAICFIAGLTEIDTRKLIVMASLGRIPGLLSLTVFGNSLALGQIKILVLTGIIVLAVSAAAWISREKIIQPGENIRNPVKTVEKKLKS